MLSPSTLLAPNRQAESIRQTVKDNKVVVYSKSYCPYCSEVKGLFTSLQVPALVIELDQTRERALMIIAHAIEAMQLSRWCYPVADSLIAT